MTINLTAVILTKNEENIIKECLNSLSFCDEKIIIDDFSTDKTTEIAKAYGAIVFKRSLDNDFAQQRNFGLEKATGDWVLFVDADERLSHSLQYEITTKTSDSMSKINGYYLKRFDTIWGKKITHGEVGSVTLLRLAKRNSGKWKGRVHEVWDIKGNKDTLVHTLDHYPHQVLSEFLREINYYSTLRAQELVARRKKTNILEIVFFPLVKFILNYFFRLGFLDGIQGFIIAIVMSLHSFLVRGKIWYLTKMSTTSINT